MDMVTATKRDSLVDFWRASEKYRACGDALGLDQSPFRLALAEVLHGRRKVLDLACGDGANLPFLPAGIEYTGCEYSAPALERLMVRTDHREMTKQTYAGDVRNLPVESNSQDAIISSYSFEHFHEVPVILDECDRVLQPGGILVIFGPDYSAPDAYSPPQAKAIEGGRVRLIKYTLDRILRRLKYSAGQDRILFEYVEPLPLNEHSFQPDHDLTHLTDHSVISKYMQCKGYEQVTLQSTAGSASSFVKRVLAKLGLWGTFGDACVILKKPETPVSHKPPQVTELLVHRQPA